MVSPMTITFNCLINNQSTFWIIHRRQFIISLWFVLWLRTVLFEKLNFVKVYFLVHPRAPVHHHPEGGRPHAVPHVDQLILPAHFQSLNILEYNSSFFATILLTLSSIAGRSNRPIWSQENLQNGSSLGSRWVWFRLYLKLIQIWSKMKIEFYSIQN